jgi:hypothetical protein
VGEASPLPPPPLAMYENSCWLKKSIVNGQIHYAKFKTETIPRRLLLKTIQFLSGCSSSQKSVQKEEAAKNHIMWNGLLKTKYSGFPAQSFHPVEQQKLTKGSNNLPHISMSFQDFW